MENHENQAVKIIEEIRDYCQSLREEGPVDIRQVIHRCDNEIKKAQENGNGHEEADQGMLLDVGRVNKFKVSQVLTPEQKITVSMEIADPSGLDFEVINQFRAAGKNAPIVGRFICRQLPMMDSHPVDPDEDGSDPFNDPDDPPVEDATYKIKFKVDKPDLVKAAPTVADAVSGLDPDEIAEVKIKTGPRSWSKLNPREWGSPEAE